MVTSLAPAGLVERLASARALDRIADPLRELVERVPDPARSVLRGDWLGHPLHPMLTDLPIGFWTTSWLLDLTVPRRAARTSTAMVGVGVAAAVPTIAAGLADWPELSRERRRVGLAHLGLNLLATAAYASSFAARVGGRRGRGIALGMLGAGLATASGYLGGHLAFGSDGGASAEADPARDPEPVEDHQVLVAAQPLPGAAPAPFRI
jgi:uncharacterized membrane protein